MLEVVVVDLILLLDTMEMVEAERVDLELHGLMEVFHHFQQEAHKEKRLYMLPLHLFLFKLVREAPREPQLHQLL
ncbi:MAG: hypothetical protein EB133_13095 [Betaproteobacteria bacterium]|nr:hypothetical protein [Betaproteobacteria bacterium]